MVGAKVDRFAVFFDGAEVGFKTSSLSLMSPLLADLPRLSDLLLLVSDLPLLSDLLFFADLVPPSEDYYLNSKRKRESSRINEVKKECCPGLFMISFWYSPLVW